MIYRHFEPMAEGIGVFHPVSAMGSRVREWTFLPPIIDMWCRADGMPAVQVRDNTQLRAKNIEVMSLVDVYNSALSGVYIFAATIIEANPDEYRPSDPTELVYDTVAQIAARPSVESFSYGPTGWGTAATLVAYGGNNDGAVCGRVTIDRINSTDTDVYFLSSPGILRIDRYFSHLDYIRMDWTGGANWATVDAYCAERTVNVGIG